MANPIQLTYNPQGTSLGSYLQGSMPSLQGSSPSLQGTPTQVKKPTTTSVASRPVVGNPAATAPKDNYIDQTLASNQSYASSNPNIFGGGSTTGNANSTPESTTPPPPPDPYSAYKMAAESYINSLAPSAGTTSAKQKYSDYVSSANLGISNLEGQGRGIPLGLVRGQQEKLYNQSEIEAQRLQGDINIAQGSDQSSQAQQLAKMNFEQSLLKPQSSPVSVAQGSSLVDPVTGKVLFNSPAKADNPTGIVGEYNDALSLGLIPKTTTLQQFVDDRKPTSTTVNNYGGSTTGNPAADSWIKLIQTNQAKIGDVPKALQNAVSTGLANSPQTSQIKQDALASANDLLTQFNAGNTGAVGGSSIFNFATIPGSDKANFINALNTLKSQLSLSNVNLLKGQGAVSDAERALLAAASSKLSTTQSETEFKKTLQDVINALSGKDGGLSATPGSLSNTPDYGSLYGF